MPDQLTDEMLTFMKHFMISLLKITRVLMVLVA